MRKMSTTLLFLPIISFDQTLNSSYFFLSTFSFPLTKGGQGGCLKEKVGRKVWVTNKTFDNYIETKLYLIDTTDFMDERGQSEV